MLPTPTKQLAHRNLGTTRHLRRDNPGASDAATIPPFDLRKFGLGAPGLNLKPSPIDRAAAAIDGKLLAPGNDDVPEAAHCRWISV